MDLLNGITEVVKSVGFPVAAYGSMFWYCLQLTQRNKELSDKMTDALNNNTEALVKLSERLEDIERR